MFRFTLILILGALTGVAGWWTLFINDQVNGHKAELLEREARIDDLETSLQTSRARVEELDAEVQAKAKEIRELKVSMYLLKVDHRVAIIEVIDQVADPDNPGEVLTTVHFIEVDEEGEPLGDPVEAVISGKTVYLDSQVIKFEDEFVEGGDFLRGTSVALFRRIFGENQAPSAGTEIDSAGVHPHPYGGAGDGDADVYYAELWQQFWDYANDPEAAAERGVRAIHGEAPSIEARPGKRYRVELRASGGLSIRPEQ